MRWLLDSNVMIEAMAGVSSASRALQRAARCEWCGFSAISRLEIFGFPKLTPADDQRLEVLLGQFIEVPVSDGVIAEAIRIRKLIRIKTPDALIAASAMANQATLITRNLSDFRQVPGLKVIDTTTL
jgi:predicted nucleic acid-binding protein